LGLESGLIQQFLNDAVVRTVERGFFACKLSRIWDFLFWNTHFDRGRLHSNGILKHIQSLYYSPIDNQLNMVMSDVEHRRDFEVSFGLQMAFLGFLIRFLAGRSSVGEKVQALGKGGVPGVFVWKV
jgi:hypothetical protein